MPPIKRFPTNGDLVPKRVRGGAHRRRGGNRRKNVGKRVHCLRLTDQQIIRAVLAWHAGLNNPPPLNPDTLTEEEGIAIRQELGRVTGLPHFEVMRMVSLHWLRDELVSFRKKHLI